MPDVFAIAAGCRINSIGNGHLVAGAGFGALVSGMVAHDIPNHELEAFEQGIAEGKILLLLDVPKERVDEFVEIITSHHPEAEIGITTAP